LTTASPSTPIEWRLLYDAPCSLYTHPRQLAASALLAGHEPAPLEGARVLEVGSALGGNLTPIAATMPSAECIGVDPFVEQTEQAQWRAQRAHIHNVRYLPIGVEELDQVEGDFDYIICHGLLSWIPVEAQRETFELCARRLSARGVAYISYNTYPKWHQLMYVRDALRWRGEQLRGGESFELEARRALAFFAEHASTSGEASTRAIFKQAHENLKNKPDYYLAHEYLLEENHPFYFHEVISQAASAGGAGGHGLCYLADLSLNVQRAYAQLKRPLQRELQVMGDSQLALQQNLDFLYQRSLRRSLFIRSDAPRAAGVRGCPRYASPRGSQLAPELSLEELSAQWIASPFQPESLEGFSPLRPQRWRHRHTGAQHLISEPLAQCALLLASVSWPQPLPKRWPEQALELYQSFGGAERSEQALAAAWRDSVQRLSFLELISPPMSAPPPLLSQAPERAGPLPSAAPHLLSPELSLGELRVIEPREWRELTNLYHETTLASPALSAILPALSSKTPRQALVEHLTRLSQTHTELFDGPLHSGAALTWPTAGLKDLNPTEQLYYLLQEAYELALLYEERA